MIDVIQKKNCTGCKLCSDLCPVNAITYETDWYGFDYPKVDYGRCVSCKKCIDNCPGLNGYEDVNYKEPLVYAAWLKELKMRLYSTSGGVYYALAKTILDEGGIVAACRFTHDWKGAEHVIVDHIDELLPTVQSKYFQSETLGIYKKIEEEIKKGRKVLFCGTPCQSVSLQQYLGGYCEDLITMDFICRGNNSPKAYQAFIEELEKRYDSPVKSVQFKNKRNGWTSLGILIKFENGQEYYDTRENSYWTLGYIRNNLYMRPACHECQFRTIPRKSDFTVGDFWGVADMSKEDIFNGISVLFVNTVRAGKMLDGIKDKLFFEPRNLNEVIKGNPCILDSPKTGKMKEQFFELLEKENFTDAVAECCGRL